MGMLWTSGRRDLNICLKLLEQTVMVKVTTLCMEQFHSHFKDRSWQGKTVKRIFQNIFHKIRENSFQKINNSNKEIMIKYNFKKTYRIFTMIIPVF